MNGGALNSKAVTYGVLAVIGIVAVYLLGKKLLSAGATAASAVGNAVNPVNPNNIFATGVNSVGASVSGDKSWSLGGYIYDLTHPNQPYGDPAYAAAFNNATANLNPFGSLITAGKAGFDWLTGSSYDPSGAVPDSNTPPVSGSTIATSPVATLPAVLPYSYKQSVVDVPGLLGTETLLTPPYGYGSSGAWAESGVPGVGPQNTYTSPLIAGSYPGLSLQ